MGRRAWDDSRAILSREKPMELEGGPCGRRCRVWEGPLGEPSCAATAASRYSEDGVVLPVGTGGEDQLTDAGSRPGGAAPLLMRWLMIFEDVLLVSTVALAVARVRGSPAVRRMAGDAGKRCGLCDSAC